MDAIALGYGNMRSPCPEVSGIKKRHTKQYVTLFLPAWQGNPGDEQGVGYIFQIVYPAPLTQRDRQPLPSVAAFP
jgi:hypothetical protein